MNAKFKTYKKEVDYSYTMGASPTLELLKQRPLDVATVLISEHAENNKAVAEIKNLCATHKLPIEVSDRAISKLSSSTNTYAIGIFNKYTSALDSGQNHLVLVNPSDMGNLGTIIRTMVGFGCKNLAIIKPAVDIFDPKVLRASMGALFSINFEYFDSFDAYKAQHTPKIYTFMTDGNASLKDVVFSSPYALVFGNEGAGLDASYHNNATSVKIPYQSVDIDSLNLSMAVGIVLYRAYVGQ